MIYALSLSLEIDIQLLRQIPPSITPTPVFLVSVVITVCMVKMVETNYFLFMPQSIYISIKERCVMQEGANVV